MRVQCARSAKIPPMKGGQMVTHPCAPLPTIEFKYLQLVSTCNCFEWCMIARRVSKPNICTPPPVSKNHLAQEPTPGSAVKFSHHFFYQGSGFFMFLVDVGQLFRCAGHHFMCVTMGPPIRGDPISHSQAHIPLKPLPPALDAFPEAPQTGIQDGVSQEEGFHVSAS